MEKKVIETKETILIVDDQALNIQTLSKLLKDEYHILIATSGLQALEIIEKQEKPDLILLDINMPEMNGYEVCKTLKNKSDTKDIPIIFVTALDGVEDEEKGFHYGAVDYISKPFQPIIVRARVKNQIKLKRTEKALISARETAIEASKAKSEFIANMSHEIRTPLNGVIGFTELLLQSDLNNLQKEYAENANISGKALLEIINDVLDFSKIEAGQLELENIKINFLNIIESVFDILKFQSAIKGLELILNIPNNIPEFIEVDPIRLKQILINLINNAVKFTEKGYVELKVLFTDLGNNYGKYEFFIIDTGIGIKEEDKKYLFNAFSQVDNSTTRRFGGTGLGLTISSMLVKKMGGELQVNSQYNKGSEFYFSISTNFIIQESKYKISEAQNTKALVISNNERIVSVLINILDNWNVNSHGAKNGIESMKILRDKSFDFIFIDYNMVYINAYKLLQLMQKNNINIENTKIILLNNINDSQNTYDKLKEFNIHSFLIKPIKKNDILKLFLNIYNKNYTLDTNKNEELSLCQKNIYEKNFNILVVEDTILNMVLVKAMLSSILPKSKIVEAVNGKEAINKFKEENISIIFMDIQMPILDGISATREIRKLEKLENKKNIPIIALTANSLKEEKERAISCGMNDFLSKPIESEKLANIFCKYF